MKIAVLQHVPFETPGAIAACTHMLLRLLDNLVAAQ